MKSKKPTATLAATFLALLSGNSSADVVHMSAEAAFQKASETLVAMDAMPEFRDKDLLAIKSEPTPVTLSPDQADCGKLFGIPYLKDKRTKVTARYQITIKPIDSASSDITVKITLDGYMDVNEGKPFFVKNSKDSNKVLTCTSNCWLEAEFMHRMLTP